MQENRGSADTTPIQDSTHTMRLRLRCAIALQPGPARTFTVRTLTSVDHYAEGMGNNYVADDLAGCRRERLTTKQLSVTQW